MWHVTDRVNVYANYGQGFETPTFIELAYRTVGSGLNFALQPAVSNSGEIGLKALFGRDQRVNLAAFDIRHLRRDRHRHRDRRPHDVQERRRRPSARASKPRGRATSARGFAGLRVVHVPLGEVHRRRHHRRAAANRARGRAAAGRAGNERVRRAVVVVPAGGRAQRRAGGPVRRQDLRQRPQHRCGARVDDREPARRLRADGRSAGYSANSCGSTTSRTSTTSAPSSSATRTAATSSRRATRNFLIGVSAYAAF